MRLIQSLMGRRQFLIGAFMTSALGLGYKKVAGAFTPGFQRGTALASERSGAAELKGHFSDKYSHLLSPIKIGNVILKNRMMSCNATPHFLQGPENYPSDAVRNYFVNLAKNGAGVIIPRIIADRVRKDQHGDSAHMVIYDLEDYGVQNYIDQMVEAVHCYDTKVCHSIRIQAAGAGPGGMPGGGAPGEGAPGGMPGGMPGEGAPGGAPGGMPGGMFGGGAGSGPSIEDLQKMIEDVVAEAKYFYNRGFDMVNLRQSFLTKNRTDKYGGKSIKNRARFIVELCQAIKKECGQDFLIWYPVTVIEPWINLPSNEDLYNMDEINDIIALAKELEGYVDILEIRDAGANTAFTMEETDFPLAVRVTQAIKESGAKIPVAPNGGFRDLDLNEEFIATGKTDLISMGRPFICDWEYGKKAYEGRGEDAVPCIMCNKCHGISNSSDWYTVCSVNPKIAIEPAMRGIEAPTVSRKVAVIGGGPAGMKAALVAVERGHKVTLYEKSGSLGGLLMHADFFPYKWPLRNFKDYLVRQVNKVGVEVLLNTEATPEMIRAKGYEAVLVGVGADLVIPQIPGVDGSNVWNVVSVCGNEKSLGKNVVVIGAGETGTEAGMYLAKSGHNVTVMTSERELVKNNRVHYPSEIVDAYKRLDNFTPITGAIATRISRGKVTYTDAKGSEKSVKADSVVVYSGLKPKQDEALKFYGSAKRFFIIGECGSAGFGVQRTIRDAFFAASQI